MKRLSASVLLLTMLFGVVGCEPYDPKPKKKPGGYHPPATTEVTQNTPPPQEVVETTPPPQAPTTPEAPQQPAVPPTPPVKVEGELPYAKAVPGKPGFVTSPYDPYKGYIDVRGFPPGTEVKDPYSGKTFLVPPF